jgi:hypothetical protein
MDKRYDSSRNADLIADAGKVHMDKPQMWGKGIISDVKRTVLTHWKDEMINLNQKTIAVTLLLFISVIAPTLTFGAVYGKVTENRIGAIETILATAWVGCTYALFGGMPTVCKSVISVYSDENLFTNSHVTLPSMKRLSASLVLPVPSLPSLP